MTESIWRCRIKQEISPLTGSKRGWYIIWTSNIGFRVGSINKNVKKLHLYIYHLLKILKLQWVIVESINANFLFEIRAYVTDKCISPLQEFITRRDAWNALADWDSPPKPRLSLLLSTTIDFNYSNMINQEIF